ncbi:unnamed protein product, partial [Rotaria sp. Silwood1]
NDIEKVRNILPFINNTNIINKIQISNSLTCFYIACYYGHGDKVKILLEYGALRSIKNLQHSLIPYEEVEIDNIKKLFLQQKRLLFSKNDYDYFEWSMEGDDLLSKWRKFRQTIDFYKAYDNYYIVSKL